MGDKHLERAGEIMHDVGHTIAGPAKSIAQMTKGTKIGKVAGLVAGATKGIEKTGGFIDKFSEKMRSMNPRKRKKAALKMAKHMAKKHGGAKTRKRLNQVDSMYGKYKKLRRKGKAIMAHGRTIHTAARAGHKGMTSGTLPSLTTHSSRMIGRAHTGNGRMIGSNGGGRYIQNSLN